MEVGKVRISEEIAKLAGEAFDAMETATKSYDPNETYVRVKEDAPQWVRDVVREAHGIEILPDDFRYETIQDAFGRIHDSEGSEDSEVSFEFADGADIYSADLLKWVGSHLSRPGYVDEAVKEFGEPRDFYHSIQMGQYAERQEIFDAVLGALAEMVSDSEDEDESGSVPNQLGDTEPYGGLTPTD